MKYKDKEILVFNNIEQIVEYAVEKWAEAAEQAVKERGYFTAALSGGRTPVMLHKALSKRKGLPWDRTHIFIVDERFVPFDNEDSNYLMIQDTLLKHVRIPLENIHPVITENCSPISSAENYEREMVSFFNLAENEFPRFDLIFLGIGEDGHTASLFPGTPALNETRHLTSAVKQSVKPGKERVTLTFPAINNAENIILMATGGDKAAAIREVIEEESSLPAAMVRPDRGKLFFLLDQDAGSLLSN